MKIAKKCLKTSTKSYEITYKQLKLMLNLLNNYTSEISIKYWKDLLEVIQSNEVTLRQLIKKEESAKRRKKADDALDVLLKVLDSSIYHDHPKIA